MAFRRSSNSAGAIVTALTGAPELPQVQNLLLGGLVILFAVWLSRLDRRAATV